ncbi:MAG: PDC sensor domain-containing protein [Halothiobacillaceae bacterium]|jgi:hypothetical protein|nr:PDC sensor domain-containing protein [Halothiobacillaceae bacterium]MDY0050392.1 PDC sensor domain-containing protein [Halothiobacillaceae bacterium]
MLTPNYVSLIERYHEHRDAIRELLESIITGIAESRLLADQEAQRQALQRLTGMYPFVDMLYVLDEEGVQRSEFAVDERRQVSGEHDRGLGRDRSQRPYYVAVRAKSALITTEPYLSSTDRGLCLSAALPLRSAQTLGYLVIDVDLERLIGFILGDTARRRFEPFFKGVYTLMAMGLLAVAGILFFSAGAEILDTLSHPAGSKELRIKPFEIIIVLTLALAIFDLAKTVFEEEVLMEKDIFRHSSTRRTITRFVAAILIALSIEGLLLMFKAAMGYGDQTGHAALIILASAGLLTALGVYVYLGARAEAILLGLRRASPPAPPRREG